MEDQVGDMNLKIIYRPLCLVFLFVICYSNLIGQSDFFNSRTIGNLQNADGKEELFQYIKGDVKSEEELTSTSIKGVKVKFHKGPQYNSTTAFHEVLNANSTVRELNLEDAPPNFNFLELGLDKLQFIERVDIKIDNNVDQNQLWSQLKSIKSLTQISITGTNSILIVSSEFIDLVSDIKRLRIAHLNIEIENILDCSLPLETLILENIKQDFGQGERVLKYFSNSKIKELNFLKNGKLKNENLSDLATYGNLKCLSFSIWGNESNIDFIDHLPSSLELLHFANSRDSIALNGIQKLINLEDLYVRSRRQSNVINIKEVAKVKGLRKLECMLDTVPSDIGNLELLELLSISGRIRTIPASIRKLKKLKKLKISRSQLQHLPNEIGMLQQLEELEIEGDLMSLPQEIGGLKQLRKLDLTGNQLQAIPRSISKLKKLESIALGGESYNVERESSGVIFRRSTFNIDGLPKEIFKIKTLKTIDISNTKIEDAQLKRILDLATGQECDQLSILLSNCDIKKFPEGDYQNLSLETLDLSQNDISTLPKSIYFNKVKSIDLVNNNGFLPYSDTSRGESMLWGVLVGTLDKSDVAISDSIPWTISSSRYKISAPMLDLSFSVDPENTSLLIEKKHQADYFFYKEQYDRSVEIYDSYIEDNDSLYYGLSKNTVSNYWIRYLAGLKKNSNQEVLVEHLVKIENQIKDAEEIRDEDVRHRMFVIGKVYLGIFYSNIDDEKSNYYFEKASKSIKEQLNQYSLDALELCVVSGMTKLFDEGYIEILLNKNLTSEEEVIIEYLKGIRDIVGDQAQDISIERLNKMIKEVNVEFLNWDPSIVEIWALFLPNDKKKTIQKYNRLIGPQLNYYPAPIDRN